MSRLRMYSSQKNTPRSQNIVGSNPRGAELGCFLLSLCLLEVSLLISPSQRCNAIEFPRKGAVPGVEKKVQTITLKLLKDIYSLEIRRLAIVRRSLEIRDFLNSNQWLFEPVSPGSKCRHFWVWKSEMMHFLEGPLKYTSLKQ